MTQQTDRAELTPLPIQTIGQQVRENDERLSNLERAVRQLVTHVHTIERINPQNFEEMMTVLDEPRRGTLPPEVSQ